LPNHFELKSTPIYSKKKPKHEKKFPLLTLKNASSSPHVKLKQQTEENLLNYTRHGSLPAAER
jgi:hypothetical protein